MTAIGIISDTHGSLDSKILKHFKQVDHIIHAGDIGSMAIIDDLKKLAPVTAVRGNTDHGSWATAFPLENIVTIQGVTLYVLHDLYRLDLDPASIDVHAVIHGHTHHPERLIKQNVLYFNPGSASHGRQGAPPSIGKIELNGGRLLSDIIPLR